MPQIFLTTPREASARQSAARADIELKRTWHVSVLGPEEFHEPDQALKILCATLLAESNFHGAVSAADEAGAQTAFCSRFAEIVQILEANSDRLDSAHDFARFAHDGLRPPALEAFGPSIPAEKACSGGHA